MTPFYGILITFLGGMLSACVVLEIELFKSKKFDNKNEVNTPARRKRLLGTMVMAKFHRKHLRRKNLNRPRLRRRNLCCK
jgi:hypothetical protein